MRKKRTWGEVTKGIEDRLNRAYGFDVQQKAASTLVDPTDGPFGSEYDFDGGRTVRIEVQSTQILGFAGFSATYEVFARSERGAIIPNLTRPGRSSRTIGSHVAPLTTYRQTLEAGFDSQFGYHWRIRFDERVTTDSQSKPIFRVFREQI